MAVIVEACSLPEITFQYFVPKANSSWPQRAAFLCCLLHLCVRVVLLECLGVVQAKSMTVLLHCISGVFVVLLCGVLG